jgi:hypothetical protein
LLNAPRPINRPRRAEEPRIERLEEWRGGGVEDELARLTMSHRASVTNIMTALSLLTEAEIKMNMGLKAVMAMAPAASHRSPRNRVKAMK